MGLAPSAAWTALPPSTPLAHGPLPHTSLGHPLPEHCKKSQGVGGKKGGRVGREGLWLEGRVLHSQWGFGGDLPKGSWGQTHIWGLSIQVISNSIEVVTLAFVHNGVARAGAEPPPLSAPKSQRFLRFAIAMPIADLRNRSDFRDKRKQCCIAI